VPNEMNEMPQIGFTCCKFVGALSAWHDGELAETAERRLHNHRSSCHMCARYARAFLAAIAFVKIEVASAEARPDLPEDTAHMILAGCRQAN
jgi:hypothetical protein